MSKIISVEEAAAIVKDGDVIMIGGFLGVGCPDRIIDALCRSGRKNLTLICNDSGFIDKGPGKLVVNKQFSRIIASHIGTNKETGRQMLAGETEVILTPQGTLIEQIRCAGFGLGGALTKTGLGTEVEKGKLKVMVDGEEYLLEKPLRANVAILFANTVDRFGNMNFHGATRNFNQIMATAADVTIVEAAQLVEVGELDPDHIHTPGIFIDHIVDGGVLS